MQTREAPQGWSRRARTRSAEEPADSTEVARLDWEQQRRVLQSLAGSTQVCGPLRGRLQMLLDRLAADGRRTQSVNEFLETTLGSLGDAGAPVEVSLELCLQVERVRNDSGG